MFKILRSREATDYFMVTGLIAVSGFPYFMVAQLHFLLLFLFVCFIFLKRSIVFDSKIMAVVLFFLVVEVLQFLFIKPFEPVMIAGTFIRMFLGYFVISLTRERFAGYLVNILYVCSIISFSFFIPSILSHGFFNFFVAKVCPLFDTPFAEQTGFYTVWPTNILFCFHECVLTEYRNPGPFWEPGLFAVFLVLALLFNLIREQRAGSRVNIVLTLALISTFSTAGYLAFFVLIAAYYFVRQNVAQKALLGIILIPAVLGLYFSLDFLSTKIEQNIQMAGTTTSSRFGSALADLSDFAKSPLIGWGRGVMRFGGKTFSFFSEDQHRNNSVTDLLATYGLFLFLFFFYRYYVSLKSLCIRSGMNVNFAAYALAVVLMLGFSQSIFLKPFFYSLLFIGYMPIAQVAGAVKAGSATSRYLILKTGSNGSYNRKLNAPKRGHGY